MKNIKTIKRFVFILVSILSCSWICFQAIDDDLGSFTSNVNKQNKPKKMKNSQEFINMTVFIHGTVGPHVTLQTLKRLLTVKKQDKSWYEHYIELVKKDYIHSRQPINAQGLVAIDFTVLNKKDECRFTGLTAKLYDMTSCSSNNQNAESCYYTFGWNGRLHSASRLAAARNLYNVLAEETLRLEGELGKKVKINLVTHSHGGNVALNLALAEKKYNKKLTVDRLVMFGCPVQSETEDCANSEVFKKIYHFYSSGDHVQIADFLTTKDLLSRRKFKDGKVCQIKVSVGKNNPTHYELWLFGFKRISLLYRKKLSSHPLPMVVFSPVSLEVLEVNNTIGNDVSFSFNIKDGVGDFKISGNDHTICKKCVVSDLQETASLFL